MVSEEDGSLLCRSCYERWLIRKLREEDRDFDSCNGVLGLDLFGVATGGYLDGANDAAEVKILVSVFNVSPTNELQVQIECDVSALPYHGNWQGFVMDEPTLAYWFSEDMVSSFFLFRLPDEWSGLFALEPWSHCGFRSTI